MIELSGDYRPIHRNSYVTSRQYCYKYVRMPTTVTFGPLLGSHSRYYHEMSFKQASYLAFLSDLFENE